MKTSSFRFVDYRSAFRPSYRDMSSLVKLGLPFAVSLIAEMAMMWTDIWFIAKLGVDSLASASLAFSYTAIFFVGGLGLVIIVNPLVSEKIGAKNNKEAMELMVAGVWVSIAAGLFIGAIIMAGPQILLAMGQDVALVEAGRWYMYLLAPGLPFALATVVVRGFYAATNRSFLFGVIFCGGLLLNAGLDYVLVFGKFGLPPLGIVGASLATLGVNTVLFFITFSVAFIGKDFRHYNLWTHLKTYPKLPKMQTILVLGIPVSISFMVEETFFMGSTFLVGYLGKEALAIHQVMVVIGLMGVGMMWGFAEGARSQLGWALGRKDVRGFIGVATSFTVVGVILMSVAALFLFFFANHIAGQFFDIATTPTEVIRLFEETAKLWSFYLLSEVPVAVFVSIMYALGDTRSKMLLDLTIYWLIAFPVLGVVIFWITGSSVYDVWLWSGNALVLMSICTGVRCYIITKRKMGDLVTSSGKGGFAEVM